MRWAGFRKVRGTVCKRVARRINALGLKGVEEYRSYLEMHDEEWLRLDAMCRIPISRFWRDRAVYDALASDILPTLAERAINEGRTLFRIWSAGSASGEEPYSLRLAWSLHAEQVHPFLKLEIIATEIDDVMMKRARAGLYQPSSLRDMPAELVGRGFRRAGDLYQISSHARRDVTFVQLDIRTEMPEGMFDLILCRNLVFTYFDRPTQTRLLKKMCTKLHKGGALVIGGHEKLPDLAPDITPWNGPLPICRYLEG